MGGAGRWFDKNVLQNSATNLFLPAALVTMPYQAATGTGMFKKHKGPALPASPDLPPDLTDQAIRDAERRQKTGVQGSRRSAFLSGPLGDQSNIPLMTKSILG